MPEAQAAACRRLLDDYEAEQAELHDLLLTLDERDWARPTPAAGWDVRDQVSHLADTEEVALGTVTGGARAFHEEVPRFATGEAFTEAGCERGRAMSPDEVLDWWWHAAGENRAALRQLDPSARVPWGLGMGVPAFLTARLMEHWAHGLDIRAAVGRPAPDHDRLRHIAWLGVRSLPYAFRVAGVAPPDGRTLRVELTGPDCAFGPAGATDVVRGPAGQFCRLAVQRIKRSDATDLTAEGPLAELALDHARAFL